MTTRIGPWSATAVVAVAGAAGLADAVTIARSVTEWRTSWFGAVGWHAGAAQLLGPLGAGVGAAAMTALRRSDLGTVIRAGRSDHRVLLDVVMRTFVVIAVVHVLAFAAVFAVCHRFGLAGTPGLTLAAGGPALLAVAGCTALGGAAGWRAGRLAVVPLVIVAAFIALTVLPDSVPGSSWVTGLVLPEVGQKPAPSWLLSALAAWALLLTVAACVVAGRWVIGGVLTLAVLVLSLIGPGEVTRDGHESLVCSGRKPAVCVFPERRRLAQRTRTSLIALSSAFDREVATGHLRGVERWQEGVATANRETATLYVADPDDQISLARDVVAAAGRCGSAPIDAVLQFATLRAAGVPVSPAELGFGVPDGYLVGARLARSVGRAAAELGRC